MTRIVITCPNPKCREMIVLSATSQVRLLANEKAEFVHEDLEEQVKAQIASNLGQYMNEDLEKPSMDGVPQAKDALEKGNLIPPKPRVNQRMAFEAVMTSYQPPEFFEAVLQACRDRRLFSTYKRTLQQIHNSGEYTVADVDYVLKAYDAVNKEAVE